MTIESRKIGQAIYPSLAGCAVFITGGASGIGAGLVKGFMRQGAKVAFVDIDSSSAEELNSELTLELGQTAWFRKVDMTVAADVESAIEDACKEMGGIDVLVNNVANDQRHKVEDFTADKWRNCMAVNLDSAFIASRAAYLRMKPANRGSIINLSSIAAILGLPDMPGYVTAKAGLIGMTKALSKDFGVNGIRVNAILPGWVATEKQLTTWLTPQAEERWRDQLALKERLTIEDVANLALFLAADDSRMITGQSLVIDAGRT